MRVGLIIYGELKTVSGGYLYDRMLVRQLRAQGDEVIPISLPWRNYVRHLGDNLDPRLARHCHALKLDILLQDELNHPSLFHLNRRLCRALGVPLISIVHHLRSDEKHPTQYVRLYRAVEASYLNSVDGFIFNSESTRKAVHSMLKKPKPGIVAYPAADHIDPPSTEATKEMTLTRSHEPGPLRVLAVGNVIERKNLHTLIAALALLPTADWRLTVVGSLTTEAAYVQRLQAQIIKTGLDGGQVTFNGAVESKTLRHHYANSHVMALPSYEGFGIAYLEAMSFGVIPIASTAGAAHEIITDSVDGFLVEPRHAAKLASHLHALHLDRKQLARMGLAARARYDRHLTWKESMNVVFLWLHEIDTRKQ